MSDARSVLKDLNHYLQHVSDKLGSSVQADDINIDATIAYLNDAIRKLDHTVETLSKLKHHN